MKNKIIIVMVMLTVSLVGCNLTAAPATPTTSPTSAPTLEFNQPTSAVLPAPTVSQNQPIALTPGGHQSVQQVVLDQAFLIIEALKDKDMNTLSQYVSPHMGLRLSPYASVKDSDQVFPSDKVGGLLTDPSTYDWGAYSGSGQPLSLTFTDYYAKFIYDVDFTNAPQVSLNFRMGVSTSMDNAAEYYAGSMVVEFHFQGFDLSLSGMDWRSLRLVFMPENNAWYLVGIIHDQWTT
jgi:hypothetical protein